MDSRAEIVQYVWPTRIFVNRLSVAIEARCSAVYAAYANTIDIALVMIRPN